MLQIFGDKAVGAVADPGGVQQCKCTPLKKSKKKSFLAIFEGFGPIGPCCVCHTTESAQHTWTRWAGTPTNP